MGEGLAAEWLNVPGRVLEESSSAVAASPPTYLIAFEGDATGDPTVSSQIDGHAWVPHALWLPLVVR